jgi:hypothetical protein
VGAGNESASGKSAPANALSNQSDTPRLCFSSVDDARDFVAKDLQDGNDLLVANDLNFAKRYENGDLHIVLNLRFLPNGEECDLLFFRVPLGTFGPKPVQPFGGLQINEPVADCVDCWPDDAVLACSTKNVECNEKLITSRVCLVRAKERLDILRDICASSFNSIVKICSGSADGEIGHLGISDSSRNSSGISGLIEGRTQILDDSCRKGREFVWQRIQLDLVPYLDSISIRINHGFVWLGFNVLQQPSFQFLKLILCPTKPRSGT